RPAVTVMGQGARKVVVVMDTSASMKARDAGGTRFAAARAQAASLVSGLGEGAEVMVIESGVQPHVLAPLSRDRERAASAIRSTRPRDLPHRLTDALRTARALVGADPRAEIYVFTDGAVTLAPEKTAWALLPPPRKIAVMLVSPGNLFLEKVLRTDPQVALDVRTPDQYQGGMGEADVVVLDSVTLPRVGQGRFVFVNAVPADVPLETLGRIERPTIMDWDRSHPVMRHVEFAKVNIEDALRIRPLAA